MNYDYSKLSGKIKEVCGTQAVFAEKMGLSEKSISAKLNNERPFKQPEIDKAIKILQLADEDIRKYFFTTKVQNN